MRDRTCSIKGIGTKTKFVPMPSTFARMIANHPASSQISIPLSIRYRYVKIGIFKDQKGILSIGSSAVVFIPEKLTSGFYTASATALLIPEASIMKASGLIKEFVAQIQESMIRHPE